MKQQKKPIIKNSDNKLEGFVKKVVKEELLKFIKGSFSSYVKKAINEQVNLALKNKVKPLINEVLSEKLLMVLAEQRNAPPKRTLKETFSSKNIDNDDDEDDIDLQIARMKQVEKQKRLQLEQRKRELMADNPMGSLIYEDMNYDEEPHHSNHSLGEPVQMADGTIMDSDDAGVDISQFGF